MRAYLVSHAEKRSERQRQQAKRDANKKKKKKKKKKKHRPPDKKVNVDTAMQGTYLALGADFLKATVGGGGGITFRGAARAPTTAIAKILIKNNNDKTVRYYWKTNSATTTAAHGLPSLTRRAAEEFSSARDTRLRKDATTLTYNAKIESLTDEPAPFAAKVLAADGKTREPRLPGEALEARHERRARQRDVSAALVQGYAVQRHAFELPRPDELSFLWAIAERAKFAEQLAQHANDHLEAFEAHVAEWRERGGRRAKRPASLASALFGVCRLTDAQLVNLSTTSNKSSA